MTPLISADGLQPDNEEARSWLTDELSKPQYHAQQGFLDRLSEDIERWLNDLLSSITHSSTPLPGYVAAIVAILLVAAGAYLLRFVRRTPGGRGSPTSTTVLGDERLDADAFRDRARRALSANDPDACVLDAMRAIARRAAERTLLDDAPSLTAHEVAGALAGPFPQHADELRWAANLFDAVAYGRRRADMPAAQRILDLEATVASTRPRPMQHTGHNPEWVV